MASAMAKPCSGETTPAQASAVYQPIELPQTATTSALAGSSARKSSSPAAKISGAEFSPGVCSAVEYFAAPSSSDRVGAPRAARARSNAPIRAAPG